MSGSVGLTDPSSLQPSLSTPLKNSPNDTSVANISSVMDDAKCAKPSRKTKQQKDADADQMISNLLPALSNPDPVEVTKATGILYRLLRTSSKDVLIENYDQLMIIFKKIIHDGRKHKEKMQCLDTIKCIVLLARAVGKERFKKDATEVISLVEVLFPSLHRGIKTSFDFIRASTELLIESDDKPTCRTADKNAYEMMDDLLPALSDPDPTVAESAADELYKKLRNCDKNDGLKIYEKVMFYLKNIIKDGTDEQGEYLYKKHGIVALKYVVLLVRAYLHCTFKKDFKKEVLTAVLAVMRTVDVRSSHLHKFISACSDLCEVVNDEFAPVLQTLRDLCIRVLQSDQKDIKVCVQSACRFISKCSKLNGGIFAPRAEEIGQLLFKATLETSSYVYMRSLSLTILRRSSERSTVATLALESLLEGVKRSGGMEAMKELWKCYYHNIKTSIKGDILWKKLEYAVNGTDGVYQLKRTTKGVDKRMAFSEENPPDESEELSRTLEDTITQMNHLYIFTTANCVKILGDEGLCLREAEEIMNILESYVIDEFSGSHYSDENIFDSTNSLLTALVRVKGMSIYPNVRSLIKTIIDKVENTVINNKNNVWQRGKYYEDVLRIVARIVQFVPLCLINFHREIVVMLERSLEELDRDEVSRIIYYMVASHSRELAEDGIRLLKKCCERDIRWDKYDKSLSKFVDWLPIYESGSASFAAYKFLADLIEKRNPAPFVVGKTKLLSIVDSALNDDVFWSTPEAVVLKGRLREIQKELSSVADLVV